MAIQDDIAAYQAQQSAPKDINADIAAYQQGQQAAPTAAVVPDTSGNPVVPEGQDWTTAGGKVVGGQEEPGFLKKLDMINTGVHRGVTHFTFALMSKLPFGDRWQNAIKKADADVEAEQQHNKKTYGDLYPGIGEVGGELLATLPAGGALGGVAKGAKILGEVLPTGLKTIGKYGASATGGAGVLAGVESQKYDPENPGQLINTEKAGEALSNPLSYVLPAAATKFSTWAEAAQKLGVAKEEFPNIMARNLKEPGVTQKLSDMFFNIPATLTGVGKQAKQVENIGDDISNFIMKTAGTKEAQTADNLRAYSANIIQSTLKKMGRAEDKVWDKGFKTTPINDVQSVKDDVINAIDLLKTNKIPGYDAVVNSLNNGIRKGDMKVEDVKKLQTIMSSAAINAKSLEGGIGNELANSLSGIKDNLLNHIQNSLSPEAMKDFSAARAFSANKFELFKNAPLLQKAINDEASAHKLVNSLISEGGVLPPKKAALGILSGKGKDMVAATKIQQALESADTAGHIDLDKFLKATSPYTQSKEIMNKGAYDNLVGLNKYIKTVKESGNVGKIGQVATGAALAGGAGAGAMGMGTIGMALPLIGYSAASFVANHSPLKSLLYAVTKNLPKNTMDLVTKNIEKHLTRAGYFMSDDGVLKHKDDKDVPANLQEGIQ